MKEKVSVIVPIYNVEPYLRRCLDSLVNQKHQNLEIIIVDDCSTDNSAAIAKEYAGKYPQFVFVQRERNGGLSAARNSGMERATGEWLAFVDSDDWVTEDYVSAMYEVAKRDNADIVMSSRYYYYPNSQKTVEVSPFLDLTTESTHEEKVALCTPSAYTRLYRKSLIDETGFRFPEDIRRSEDVATVIPWLTWAKSISILRQPLYYYFQRVSSISNSNHKNIDIGFFNKAIERMMERSAPGFEKELEFRTISDLMYGMTMVMLKAKYPFAAIKKHINDFDAKHPEWRSNPYIERLPYGKRVFLALADNKYLLSLKLLIFGWNLLQSRK